MHQYQPIGGQHDKRLTNQNKKKISQFASAAVCNERSHYDTAQQAKIKQRDGSFLGKI